MISLTKGPTSTAAVVEHLNMGTRARVFTCIHTILHVLIHMGAYALYICLAIGEGKTHQAITTIFFCFWVAYSSKKENGISTSGIVCDLFEHSMAYFPQKDQIEDKSVEPSTKPTGIANNRPPSPPQASCSPSLA